MKLLGWIANCNGVNTQYENPGCDIKVERLTRIKPKLAVILFGRASEHDEIGYSRANERLTR